MPAEKPPHLSKVTPLSLFYPLSQIMLTNKKNMPSYRFLNNNDYCSFLLHANYKNNNQNTHTHIYLQYMPTMKKNVFVDAGF